MKLERCMKKIKKKDARILFNRDENAHIIDLIVAEFIFIDGQCSNSYLYQKYRSDIGNCNFDSWNKWDLHDVLFYIFVMNHVETNELKDKIIEELMKIEEFELKLNNICKF